MSLLKILNAGYAGLPRATSRRELIRIAKANKLLQTAQQICS